MYLVAVFHLEISAPLVIGSNLSLWAEVKNGLEFGFDGNRVEQPSELTPKRVPRLQERAFNRHALNNTDKSGRVVKYV